MTPERIVALLIGGVAIAFGLVLLPFADALRRRMLASRAPPPVVEVTLTRGIGRTRRNHVMPWLFMVFGAALVLFAVFDV